MFSKIIVGVDGLDGGRDAIALAKALARSDAEIVLVTAFPYEHRPSRGSVAGYEEILSEETRKILADAAGDNSRCRVHAVADLSPSRALHEEAERWHADLIVIGSCRRGVLGRVLLGDVSRAALHRAPCPVAVAPRGFRDRSSQAVATIGVGVNSTPESDAALALAARLAGSGGAKLRLLTAVATPLAMAPGYGYAFDWTKIEAENRLAAEQQLAKAAKKLDVPAETEAVDGKAGLALERLSEHVDLVVAGSRGWGTGRRVVLGSTTDRLAHHASCPVVVVPSPAADREPARTDDAVHV